jgi:hypothetical protein
MGHLPDGADSEAAYMNDAPAIVRKHQSSEAFS